MLSVQCAHRFVASGLLNGLFLLFVSCRQPVFLHSWGWYERPWCPEQWAIHESSHLPMLAGGYLHDSIGLVVIAWRVIMGALLCGYMSDIMHSS